VETHENRDQLFDQQGGQLEAVSVENTSTPPPSPDVVILPTNTNPSASVAADTAFTVQRTTVNYIVIGIVCLFVGAIIGVIGYERLSNANNEALIRRVVNTALDASRTDTQAMINQAFQTYASAGAGGSAGQNPANDPNYRFTVNYEGSPAIGPADAPVVIVGFEDFRCGYCKRFNDTTLDPLLETYADSVLYVHRDYPILGQQSIDSAVAAACAEQQGAFWQFHDRFYGAQDQLVRDAFIAYATELELDVDMFGACYDNRETQQAVYADLVEGQTLGVGGTPTFFINGRQVVGAQPYEVFAAIIEQEIAAAAAPAESDESAS